MGQDELRSGPNPLRGPHVGQSELIYLLIFEMQVFYVIQSSIFLTGFNSYNQKPYTNQIALPFVCLHSSKTASLKHVCLWHERVHSSIQSSLCYLRVSTQQAFVGGVKISSTPQQVSPVCLPSPGIKTFTTGYPARSALTQFSTRRLREE